MKIDPRSAFSKAASTAQERAASAAKIAGEFASNAAGRAGEAAAKVNDAVASGKQKIMESIYRPVFPEEYSSADFDRPKMIAIASDAERKDIQICEGSIGWSDTAAGVDVLQKDRITELRRIAYKLGAACNFSLQGEALTESRRRLVFEVEF